MWNSSGKSHVRVLLSGGWFIDHACRGKFRSGGWLPANVNAYPRCPASLLFTGVKTPPDTNRTSTAENASHVKDVVNLSSCALSVQLLWVVYHLEAPQALIQALYLLLKCLCFMLWVQCRPGWDKSWRNVALMPWFILGMSSVFFCMTAMTTTCRNRYLHILNVCESPWCVYMFVFLLKECFHTLEEGYRPWGPPL